MSGHLEKLWTNPLKPYNNSKGFQYEFTEALGWQYGVIRAFRIKPQKKHFNQANWENFFL